MHFNSNLDTTLSYVRELKAGNHGIFFYISPREKREVLFNFLQAGFQRGEGAIYVAGQETSTQVRKHMEDFGFNVKDLEKNRVLTVLNHDEFYVIDGGVNFSHIRMSGQRIFDEAMANQLGGLRVCGEVARFFERKKEKELVEYELTIGRKLEFPVTALCAYDMHDAKSLTEKFFFDLIKAHGSVVTSSFAQEIKFENFFPTIMHQTLETIFGEVGRETILRMLEERHSITPHKIANDPSSFIEGLQDLVGSGAQVVTKSIVKQMHSKIGIT